jgi:hypothetical protein
MKRLVAGLALAALAPAAFAADTAGSLEHNVGIGLGTTLFAGHNGLISQTFAATTNGTSGNQTFAITTGTSNAKQYDGLFAKAVVTEFIRDNMDAVATDVAAGRGEHLDTLAELMAIPAGERAAFAAAAQTQFAAIYAESAVGHEQVAERLIALRPAA